MINVTERVRRSGRCPPSLLRDFPSEPVFEGAVMKVLDLEGLSLSSMPGVENDFKALLQLTMKMPSAVADMQINKALLIQRRCISLAVVGSTAYNSPSLSRVLQEGFLSIVKVWLEEILNGSVGGVDLLLHLLTNIAHLPVTKSVVKSSGMGKAIGSIEKHRICSGTPNQEAIKKRVKAIKDAWNKSVKALKEKDTAPTGDKHVAKRELDSSSSNTSPTSKKVRLDDNKKSSSVSSLLRKMNPAPALPASVKARQTTNQQQTTDQGSGKSQVAAVLAPKTNEVPKKASQKKQGKRVKWADHFRGNLNKTKIIEGNDLKLEADGAGDSNGSWSDRRRRDRLHEKELLAQAKKSKLMDDDDLGMEMPATRSIKPTTAWRVPERLAERADAPFPQVNSNEASEQNARMGNTTIVRYKSDYNVPNSPAAMTDVEQALDMTSQSSTVVQSIPFFVPQQTPAPVPALPPEPAPAPTPTYSQPGPASSHTSNIGMAIPSQPPPGATGATAEIVQSLGLPMFLVGQNVQALQTLASTPSLLSTFVDSNGMYDQARLTSLVQTLTQNIAPSQQQQQQQHQPPHHQRPMGQMGPAGGYQQQSHSPYGPGAQHPPYGGGSGTGNSGGIYGPASTNKYGPAAGAVATVPAGRMYNGNGSSSNNDNWPNGAAQLKNGYRGDQNTAEGNLHVSGYGPGITQNDIIALFSPYVHVEEVVMKGTFCFVNTSDPIGAKRAREALNGANMGGAPVRINIAQRKTRENGPPSAPGGGVSSSSNNPPPGGMYGPGPGPGGVNHSGPPPMGYQKPLRNDPPGMPKPPGPGPNDFENIRDDRGNPATKNLFVAGYGGGTTENQIRDLFSQHANIIGIILKGTFSFVNTSDRRSAIHAREVLSGTMLNGGVLRINFAKETGRLGTSFDLTYGSNAQGGGGGGGGSHSHYGRGF